MAVPLDITEDEKFCIDVNQISDLQCELVRTKEGTSTYLYFPKIDIILQKEQASTDTDLARVVIIDEADDRVLRWSQTRPIDEDGEFTFEVWDKILREVHELTGEPANGTLF